MKLLHKVIFWSHLIAGVSAGVIIFMMSATGFILMYERQVVEWAERDARWVAPPAGTARRQNLEDLVAHAREANSAAQPTGVVLRNDPSAAVAVNFGRDGATYIDPYTGTMLGDESRLHDWFHDVVVWHRWLGMEGEGRATGRAITGACNLAFFWLAITGVYLWWPRSWHWSGLKSSVVFHPRLRGKARDWNWHNVIGFWSSGVLVVLTLTAAVMSYQWANDLLYSLAGSEPPPRAQAANPAAQGRRVAPSSARKPLASLEEFFARAEQQAPGWVTMTMRLPARADGPVMILIQEPSAPHIFARSQLALDRSTAEIVRWDPYSEASLGRKLRVWIRGLHTGEALGLPGQTVAGFASLGGCFLVWTGLAMAWRRFRYRKREIRTPDALIPAPAQPISTSTQSVIATTQTMTEGKRIEMEQTSPTVTNGHSHHRHSDPADVWISRGDDADSVLMLYGSMTGTAEALAHKLAGFFRTARLNVRVRDMAHCQPDVLRQAKYVFMIVSTYGDGEPPDDVVPFWEAIVQGKDLDLRGVEYSVLALGNMTFDHFCKCGRDFDAALERHGATRIFPRVDCDVDYDAPAAYWLRGVVAHLKEHRRTLLSV
jgi:uncharacterized iron-regulated membrane protein/flavodoxin